MPEPVKILVIGGTGVVGSQVVRALLERGANLRILVRDASAKVPAGVETAIGDLLDPPTVERAMDGVQKLYLLNGVVADELTQALIAYDLAKRRGLEHVLYHSVFRAEQFPDVPHFASKVAVERALRAFDVPWTIVRPNYFMQNDATMREPITKAGLYPSPLGPTGISMVDVRDIADASAIALTTGGHAGKTYNLNGPSRGALERSARHARPLRRSRRGCVRSGVARTRAVVVRIRSAHDVPRLSRARLYRGTGRSRGAHETARQTAPHLRCLRARNRRSVEDRISVEPTARCSRSADRRPPPT